MSDRQAFNDKFLWKFNWVILTEFPDILQKFFFLNSTNATPPRVAVDDFQNFVSCQKQYDAGRQLEHHQEGKFKHASE